MSTRGRLTIGFAPKLILPQGLLLLTGPPVTAPAWSSHSRCSPSPPLLSENIQSDCDEQTEAQHQQNGHHHQLLQVAGAAGWQRVPITKFCFQIFIFFHPQSYISIKLPGGDWSVPDGQWGFCLCWSGFGRFRPLPGGLGSRVTPGVAGWTLSHGTALLLDVINGHGLSVAVLCGQTEVVAQGGWGGHKAEAPILQVEVEVWGQAAVWTLPQLVGQLWRCRTVQPHHVVQRHEDQLTCRTRGWQTGWSLLRGQSRENLQTDWWWPYVECITVIYYCWQANA